MSQLEPLIYSDPAVYDAIYGDFTDDIQFYQDLAAENGTAQVCELGCGTGRIAIPLAQAGYEVTAVDRSQAMLDAARAKAESSGVHVRWVQADMASFSEAGQFSLVYVPLHSFSHLLEASNIIGALRAIRENLTPGGRFVLALHKPDPAYLSREEGGLYLVGEYKMSDGRPFTIYESTRYDSVRQRLQLHWFLEFAERTHSTRYQLRMFFPEELWCLLSRHGFEVEERYGWYDRAPLSNDSGTQIVVARRVD